MCCFDSMQNDHLNTCSPFTDIQRQSRMYTVRSVCLAFFHTLSRSTFEYNSPFLTLLERAVKTIVPAPAVAQKYAESSGLKAAAKGVSLSALRPVSIEERGTAVRFSSDHQKAWLRKARLTWNCHHIYLLICSCWMCSFSPAALSNILFLLSNHVICSIVVNVVIYGSSPDFSLPSLLSVF